MEIKQEFECLFFNPADSHCLENFRDRFLLQFVSGKNLHNSYYMIFHKQRIYKQLYSHVTKPYVTLSMISVWLKQLKKREKYQILKLYKRSD